MHKGNIYFADVDLDPALAGFVVAVNSVDSASGLHADTGRVNLSDC